MNIKKRIKRALAAFLREELLEYIGYNHEIPYMNLQDRYVINQVPFETVVMESKLSIDDYGHNQLRIEEQISRMKQEFADKVLENIHVDANDLTNHKHYRQRYVTFRLMVQKKKE